MSRHTRASRAGPSRIHAASSPWGATGAAVPGPEDVDPYHTNKRPSQDYYQRKREQGKLTLRVAIFNTDKTAEFANLYKQLKNCPKPLHYNEPTPTPRSRIISNMELKVPTKPKKESHITGREMHDRGKKTAARKKLMEIAPSERTLSEATKHRRAVARRNEKERSKKRDAAALLLPPDATRRGRVTYY